jgi:hypothetical protein
MNTKLLMTSSALVLGLAGILFLFMPDLVLSAQGVTDRANVTLVQLMGVVLRLYVDNWTAKDGIIGGIYARPVLLLTFCRGVAVGEGSILQ